MQNRARYSSNTTSSTASLVTGYTTLGTILQELDTGAVKHATFKSDRTTEWVLSSSHTYLVEIISNANNNDITLSVDFYQNT